jgi:hypothetical protein
LHRRGEKYYKAALCYLASARFFGVSFCPDSYRDAGRGGSLAFAFVPGVVLWFKKQMTMCRIGWDCKKHDNKTGCNTTQGA